MSLTVCQIDDPYAINVIYSCEVTLEADGSLDTAHLDFVNNGDTFLGYPDPSDGKVYNPLIDPTLPSTISPTTLKKNLRRINGAPALPLIRLTDYNKALLHHNDILRKHASKPTTSSIVLPHDVKRPVEAAKNAPSRTHLLPRREVNPDNPDARDEPFDIAIIVRLQRVADPNVPAIRTWELYLEYDFSLATSKLTSLDPRVTYYGRISGERYAPFIKIDRHGELVAASRLEYYLHDVPGVSVPVLFLMSDLDYSNHLRKGKDH